MASNQQSNLSKDDIFYNKLLHISDLIINKDGKKILVNILSDTYSNKCDFIDYIKANKQFTIPIAYSGSHYYNTSSIETDYITDDDICDPDDLDDTNKEKVLTFNEYERENYHIDKLIKIYSKFDIIYNINIDE